MQAQAAEAWPNQIANSYWIGLLTGSLIQTTWAVTADALGNVYLCGGSNNTFNIAKFSSSGVVQWQRRLGATTTNGYNIAVDIYGNVYACGRATVGGSSTALLTVKYNSSGTLQWQKVLYVPFDNNAQAYGIAVDASGNVYTTGRILPSSVFQTQIVKYDTSGTLIWQKTLSNSFGSSGSSVAVDSSGNVYAGGNMTPDGTNYYFQISKFNTSGTLLWQRKLSDGSGTGIAVDSSGNVYVSGYKVSNNNFIVAKYNTSGTIQWQRTLAGSGNATSIAVDSSGNVYASGWSAGFQIVKYDTSGTIQWQRTLDSSGASPLAYGIAVDSSGKIYVSGYATISSNTASLFAKLPGDGSLTGTYTVGSTSFTYAASSLSESAASLVDTASNLTDATSTLTNAVSTESSTTLSLTASVTTL